MDTLVHAEARASTVQVNSGAGVAHSEDYVLPAGDLRVVYFVYGVSSLSNTGTVLRVSQVDGEEITSGGLGSYLIGTDGTGGTSLDTGPASSTTSNSQVKAWERHITSDGITPITVTQFYARTIGSGNISGVLVRHLLVAFATADPPDTPTTETHQDQYWSFNENSDQRLLTVIGSGATTTASVDEPTCPQAEYVTGVSGSCLSVAAFLHSGGDTLDVEGADNARNMWRATVPLAGLNAPRQWFPRSNRAVVI